MFPLYEDHLLSGMHIPMELPEVVDGVYYPNTSEVPDVWASVIYIYIQHACICKSSVCVEATTALLLSKWDDSQAVKIFKMRLSNAYL